MLLTPKNQERIRVGKVVGRKTYIYVDDIGTESDIDTSLADRLAVTEVLAGIRRGEDFNLVRIDAATGEIALLNYPGFFDEAFPELAASLRLDPISGVVTKRTYADSLNPAILHRKELLGKQSFRIGTPQAALGSDPTAFPHNPKALWAPNSGGVHRRAAWC